MGCDTAAGFEAELRTRAKGNARPAPAQAASVIADAAADPHLYAGMVAWLIEQAPAVIGHEIRKWKPKPARRPKHQGPAERFGVAVQRGDLEALSDFRLVYVVNDQTGTEKCLGDMTGHDHVAVSNSFQQMGESSLMLAAVHRQIGKLLGARTTAEVMDADKYRQLLARLAPTLTL